MPNVDIQRVRQILMFAYRYVYIHTFVPGNVYNLRIKYFHNFQVNIFPVLPEFLHFWKYTNSANMLISSSLINS